MGLLLLAVSPISCSLFFYLLFPRPIPPSRSYKSKTHNYCMKTPWGELRVIMQLVKTCPLSHFYCLHVYSLPLCASPTQPPTQPRSLLAICWPDPHSVTLLSALPLLLILLCVCVCLSAETFSRSENHNYHSCQMLSSSPPSTFLL